MLNATAECKKKILDNSKVVAKGNIIFSDDTNISLDGTDFVANTIGFSHASSSVSSFDIGSAIVGKMNFTLNNSTGKFNEYDFSGSNITPYIGIPLDSGITEWIKKGMYHIDQPSVYGSTIALTAYDNMTKFQKPYKNVTTLYPTTALTIITDICLYCGVTLKGTSFANSSYQIQARPKDENMSCLDVIGYIAQICGCFAVCNEDGYLELRWYDIFSITEDTLNGGIFDASVPYSSGDNAYGGNFTDYSSGDNYDGGRFTDVTVTLKKNFNFSVNTDDVVITGIKVFEASDGYSDDDSVSTLSGQEGYVLEVKDNPFIESGKTSEIASYLFNRIGNFRFRPFTATAQSNPLIVCGDSCNLIDRSRNLYRSVITSVNYRIGSGTSLACNAETPERKKASVYSSLVKTRSDIKNGTAKELTTYDRQVQSMNQLAINALGYYETVETDATDNSRITYLHDKPTLAESMKIYKMTRNGFFLSQDGGLTYTSGFDASGNAVLNILSAIGIVCDWIKGGTLTLGGLDNVNGLMRVLNASGVETVRADKDGLFATNGTFQGKIISTDATITGGTININTSTNDKDYIKLNYVIGDTTKSMTMKPDYLRNNIGSEEVALDAYGLIFKSSGNPTTRIGSGSSWIYGSLNVGGNLYLDGAFDCRLTASFDSSATFSGTATFSDTVNCNDTVNLNDDVKIGGYYGSVGFFNSSGATKQNVSTMSTYNIDASDCASKINEVINALDKYNLL